MVHGGELMSFSAIIPLTDAPAANAALEAAGYGDGNFSVLLINIFPGLKAGDFQED
jgi:hypothetical protein